MPTLLRNFRSRTISTQTGNESLIPFDILARALLAYYAGLGINHQSPLIHLDPLVFPEIQRKTRGSSLENHELLRRATLLPRLRVLKT